MVNASQESKQLKTRLIKPKSKKATVGGFDMSPLISALLLATIKLAISQKNKKQSEQKKVSRSKSKQK
jgi:hypothetical protein